MNPWTLSFALGAVCIAGDDVMCTSNSNTEALQPATAKARLQPPHAMRPISADIASGHGGALRLPCSCPHSMFMFGGHDGTRSWCAHLHCLLLYCLLS